MGRASWKCEACEEVCPFCHQAAHAKKCAAQRLFERAERTHQVWVAASKSKRCPRCKTPIIKNGGCSHMKCMHCKHEFCWLCKKDWSTHDVCVFEKLAVAGVIALSPVWAPLLAVGMVVVSAPAMA